MEENKIPLWSEAGVPGIILGTVSIVYLLVNSFTAKLAGTGFTAILIGTLNFLLWAGKLMLCLWLLRFFLLRFSSRNPAADNRKVFHFGIACAVLSALLYSVFYLAYVLYINPEVINASFDLAMQQYSSMLDAASLEAMENMRSDMPVATFFTTLIWCFLFGTVASYIFSRHIPADADDPFKD